MIDSESMTEKAPQEYFWDVTTIKGNARVRAASMVVYAERVEFTQDRKPVAVFMTHSFIGAVRV